MFHCTVLLFLIQIYIALMCPTTHVPEHHSSIIPFKNACSQIIKQFLNMSIFSTLDEYETELNILKERLTESVRSNFDDIYIACYHGCFDVGGHLLDVSKGDFMQFTKNTHEEWCNKISCLFETSFDSVLYVMFTIDKDIEIETLDLFVDDFFTKCHIFDEIEDEIPELILIEESMHMDT